MILLLRLCVFNPGKQYLTGVVSLTQNYRAFSLKNNNVETDTSALPRANFSTKGNETKLPKGQERLVYRGILATQVRNLRSVSLMSTIITVAAQPLIYDKLTNSDNILFVAAFGAFVGFFGYLSPIVIHLIMKRYVLHMYYNEGTDTYTAETYMFLMFKKKITFTPSDVTIPEVPGAFTTCLVKGKPLFLHLNSFEGPYHYKRIMGYDKPWSFKIDDDNSKNVAATESKLK